MNEKRNKLKWKKNWNFQEALNEKYSLFKACFEEKLKTNYDLKERTNEYRSLLKKGTAYQKNINNMKKYVAKLSEELSSKTKRLEILYQNQNKSYQKIKKQEAINAILKLQLEENSNLRDENESLRTKFQCLTYKTIDKELTKEMKKELKQKTISLKKNYVLYLPKSDSQMRKVVDQNELNRHLEQKKMDMDFQIIKNHNENIELEQKLKNSKEKAFN